MLKKVSLETVMERFPVLVKFIVRRKGFRPSDRPYSNNKPSHVNLDLRKSREGSEIATPVKGIFLT